MFGGKPLAAGLSAIALGAMMCLPPPIFAESAEELTFTVVADSHYCQTQMTWWTTFARNCHTEPQWDMREANLAAAGSRAVGEFVVHLGDHIEDLTPLTHEPVEKYVNLLEQDLGGRPVYMVLGNHDIRQYKTQHVQKAARFFREVAAYPEHPTVNLVDPDGWEVVGESTKYAGRYYFFGLNSGQAVKKDKQNNHINFDGSQLKNLERELRKNPPDSTVLFWHVNPRNDIRDFKTPKGRTEYLKILCENRKAIKAVFVGHTHAFDRFSWDCGDGGERIDFYVCGSTGHRQPGSKAFGLHVRLTPDDVVILNESEIAWVNAQGFEHKNYKVKQQSTWGPQLAGRADLAWMVFSAAHEKKHKRGVLIVYSEDGIQWSKLKGPGVWSKHRPALGKHTELPIVAYVTGKGRIELRALAWADAWATIKTPFETATTPALVEKDGELRLIFLDGDGNLLESRGDGSGQWGAAMSLGLKSRSGPAAVVFGGKLCVAFRGDQDQLGLTCKEDGKPGRVVDLGAKITKTPALAVFENRLYLAYRSETDGDRDEKGEIRFGSSADGQEWSVFEKLGQRSSHSPALTAVAGRLWVGFKAASSSSLLTSGSEPKVPARKPVLATAAVAEPAKKPTWRTLPSASAAAIAGRQGELASLRCLRVD